MDIASAVTDYTHDIGLDLAPATVRTYRQGIDHLISFAASNHLFNYQDIMLLANGMHNFIDFPHWLSTIGYPKATRKVYLCAATSFLDWLILKGYANPDSQELSKYKNAIKKSNRRHQSKLPKIAPEGIVETILSAVIVRRAKSPIRERDIAIVQFLFTSGCRVAELVGLNVGDINLDSLRALVIGKGNKEAFIYFTEDTKKALISYWDAREVWGKDSPAFSRHDNATNISVDNRITTAGIRYIINRTARETGIDPNSVSPHSFRHAFAIRVLNKTGRIEIAQSLLRHSSIDTTRIYAKVSDRELREVYDNIFSNNDTEHNNA